MLTIGVHAANGSMTLYNYCKYESVGEFDSSIIFRSCCPEQSRRVEAFRSFFQQPAQCENQILAGVFWPLASCDLGK